MKGRAAAIVMAALLLVYLVLVAQRAVLLVISGNGVGVTMGIALVVLPILGAWALYRELRFGFESQHLAKTLEAEGGLPPDDLPRRPSGRPVRAAADARFPEYRAQVEAAPESWQAWFRLGLAYDASGDRRRARHAIREAIRLSRSAGRTADHGRA